MKILQGGKRYPILLLIDRFHICDKWACLCIQLYNTIFMFGCDEILNIFKVKRDTLKLLYLLAHFIFVINGLINVYKLVCTHNVYYSKEVKGQRKFVDHFCKYVFNCVNIIFWGYMTFFHQGNKLVSNQKEIVCVFCSWAIKELCCH